MRLPLWLVLATALAACSSTGVREGDAFTDCARCPEMLIIPGGQFFMGADGGEEGRPEGSVREIKIGYEFAIGRYEVTQEEFAYFLSETGHGMRGGCRIWDGAWITPDDADWTNPGYWRLPLATEPVACVTWLDASAYVAWLSDHTGQRYRLPTEAEWEYVARAGSTGDYFWGDDPDEACDWANVYDQAGAYVNAFRWDPVACTDNFGRAAPVGSFQPNAFGVYDMIGNLWEWTADCYVAPYPDTPVDGSAVADAVCDRRSVRGGSWITRASRQRLAFRGRDPEDTLFSFFGFRVARDLP